MTTSVLTSKINTGKRFDYSRCLFTEKDKFYMVTISGEDGEYEIYEVEATSSRGASFKALDLTTIVDVQYVDVAEL